VVEGIAGTVVVLLCAFALSDDYSILVFGCEFVDLCYTCVLSPGFKIGLYAAESERK
jgi:hypothetical protein